MQEGVLFLGTPPLYIFIFFRGYAGRPVLFLWLTEDFNEA